MDIDFKGIILVIIIVMVIITIIFGGYKILEPDEKNTIQNLEPLNVSKNVIRDFSTIKSDEENIEETVVNARNPLELRLIEKNNTSPKKTGFGDEKYFDVRVSFVNLDNYMLKYKVPESWKKMKEPSDSDPITGATIVREGYPLTMYGNYNEDETTYEEFLEDYMEIEKIYDTFPNYVEFTTRELYIEGYGNYLILQKNSYYSTTECMVFVYKGNVYILKVKFSNDEKGNENLLKTIDNIFSSAHISM